MKRLGMIALLAVLALALVSCNNRADEAQEAAMEALREQIQGYEARLAAVQDEIARLTQQTLEAQALYDANALVRNELAAQAEAWEQGLAPYRTQLDDLTAAYDLMRLQVRETAEAQGRDVNDASRHTYFAHHPVLLDYLSQAWGAMHLEPDGLHVVAGMQYVIIMRVGYDQSALIEMAERWHWNEMFPDRSEWRLSWRLAGYDNGNGFTTMYAPFAPHWWSYNDEWHPIWWILWAD